MYKRIAAFRKGGYFVYFSSIREAGSLCGKASPEWDEVPEAHDDRLACVLCQVRLPKKIPMMGEGSQRPDSAAGSSNRLLDDPRSLEKVGTLILQNLPPIGWLHLNVRLCFRVSF